MREQVESLSHLDGKMIAGEVERIHGVDADGIGPDPTYDVVLFPPGDPAIRLSGVRPSFFRSWQQESTPEDGVYTKTAGGPTSILATVRNGKMWLFIPEGPAIFMQDCDEGTP